MYLQLEVSAGSQETKFVYTSSLKPVSCDHVTSCNYDGKKARDVGLTC